jgi:hypothetical protein
MIITDGAPYPFDDIFNARQNPMHMARVFTYLIGRDVTEKREVMFMACANNGQTLMTNNCYPSNNDNYAWLMIPCV